MKKKIYQFIFCKLMGWKVDYDLNSIPNKCVFMVIPHTSWHDFYLGVFSRGIMGIEINFVAKKELFSFPFGAYFKYMGGEPLDRKGGQNKVDMIAAIFERKEIFRLGISPEGTRKKVDKLKTGFYYIAQKANVPIIPVAFDFGKKTVSFGSPVFTTNDMDADFESLYNHFKGVKGKIPANGFEVPTNKGF